ncbi:MAG: hypothetical protein COA45_10450 [Zetaproteobacteria bacterium]|nr:MAG: hypothetical protein COA45_10450 [Zetaproteobacteria bacterium]
MKQPDFIIGGATRSGITALSQILEHHPQIFIPQRKEHQFFHQKNLLDPTPSTCRIQFEDAVNVEYKTQIPKDRVLHGEHEYDPTRAYSGCPHAKIIFTLRDPVERAYAQFNHALAEKKETVKTFDHAIELELSSLRSPDTTGQCWIYKNQYQTHLEHWFSSYSQDQVLILIYEEWTNPAQKGLRPLETFLGLQQDSLSLEEAESFDPQGRFLSEKNSKIKKYAPLSSSTRAQLEEIFSIDKTYISNLLGREIKPWMHKI